MTTLLNGVLGGLLAGLVAGVAMQLVHDGPSPMAILLYRFPGNRFVQSRIGGFVVQLVYGGLAGVILVALELFVLGLLAVPPTVGEALGIAVSWSALLFGTLVGYSRIDPSLPFDRSHLLGLFVYHLFYGLGFGIWIRLTWVT